MATREKQSAGKRWVLTKGGNKSVLRYRTPESEKGITFDLDSGLLSQIKALAKKGDTAGIRDLLLTEERRAEVLQNPSISSLISANTWRWSLPLFGGEGPHELSGRRARFRR